MTSFEHQKNSAPQHLLEALTPVSYTYGFIDFCWIKSINTFNITLAPKRDGGKISRSSADSLVASYSSVCALHRSSEELVCSHKGIMWNYSTILFSEYLFQPFSRRNILRIKAGIECNEQKWREEAVRRVGPRERRDSSKTTRQSVYCEFIWTFCRPFATARNFRKTRFI